MTVNEVTFTLKVLLDSKMTEHMMMTRTKTFGYFSIYVKKTVCSTENVLLKKISASFFALHFFMYVFLADSSINNKFLLLLLINAALIFDILRC